MKFIIALALGLSSVMALRHNGRHNEEGNDVSGDSGV